jgi:hypothetical protein
MTKHPSPRCVVKVGDGRGFIIKDRVKIVRPKDLAENIKLRTYIERRLIVTAGHCCRNCRGRLPVDSPAM